MQLAGLRSAAERLAGRRLLVWGDLVADRFLTGTTTRVSREAPALVLQYESDDLRPGGGGNAALNAATLGARVQAVGFVGGDQPGGDLVKALESASIDTDAIIRRSGESTPMKTRVMAGGFHTVRQQILRIDHDRPWPDSAEHMDALLKALNARLVEADALLVSDYGLGTVTGPVFEIVRRAAEAAGCPITVDSRHRLLEFRGVTAATPNEGEVEEALRSELNGETTAIEQAGAELLDRLDCRHLAITRGSHGMAVFDRERPPVHLPIHGTDEIADVTGAGDTVIATLTLALAAGARFVDAARLANVAAGLVVMKHGTATVSADELLAALGEEA